MISGCNGKGGTIHMDEEEDEEEADGEVHVFLLCWFPPMNDVVDDDVGDCCGCVVPKKKELTRLEEEDVLL